MRQHHTQSQPDEPCVVFRDVAVRRGGHIIWRDGNFSIPMGSVTAIVGTNGTGKTTMMQAELGLLPLENGSIRVPGGRPGTPTTSSATCRRATPRTSNRT